jgi:pyridoxal phosphate enzyme (YggS family)
MKEIAKNLQRVRARIDSACETGGRSPDAVTLLAVSKTQPMEAIRAAYACGQRRFGENYLQEALAKIDGLADLAIEWHFIGRIQSNKTRPIAEHFAWVHGIDDLKHARRLSEQRPDGLPPLNVCIQVNLSGEQSKGGVEPEAVDALARAMLDLPGLRLRGLMALPAPLDAYEEQRVPFRRLAQLQRGLVEAGIPLDTLSMGMTDDLEAAVTEGSTLVRIGTAIFGTRAKGAVGLK